MLRQIMFKVPSLPPTRPEADEPDLFTEGGPQADRVSAFLEAASRAARDLEMDPFGPNESLKLRLIVPGRNGGDPQWALAVAEVISRLLCTQGRDETQEAHFGAVAGFGLFERHEQLLSLQVEVDPQMETGYEVQIAERAPAATRVPVEGDEKPIPGSPRRGPFTGPADASAFLSSLRAFLRSEFKLGGLIRVTPSGAMIKLQEERQGEWLEYGPFELFGGTPPDHAFEVPLLPADLYATYDFLVNNPVKWWWPLKIVVRAPAEHGVVAFHTSHGLGPMGSRCWPTLALFTPEQYSPGRERT